MTPRSILKHHRRGSSQSISPDSTNTPFPFSQCSRFDTQRVHFPPTPSLTTSETTHSSNVYDRAPIRVSPNICALPPRGNTASFKMVKHAPSIKSYFHSQAQLACERDHLIRFDSCELHLDPPDALAVPPLMSDHTSSSSEDTDAPMTPFADLISPKLSPSSLDSPIPRKDSPAELDRALSFLPHPPGSTAEADDLHSPPSPVHKSPSRRRLRSKTSLKPSSILASNTQLDDSGCLGGF